MYFKLIDRQILLTEGEVLAKDLGCGFVESSAQKRIHVEKAFYDIVRKLRQQSIEMPSTWLYTEYHVRWR